MFYLITAFLLTLEQMQNMHDEFDIESNDSKGAWNKVARLFRATSGDAIRIACMNYRNKKLKKSN